MERAAWTVSIVDTPCLRLGDARGSILGVRSSVYDEVSDDVTVIAEQSASPLAHPAPLLFSLSFGPRCAPQMINGFGPVDTVLAVCLQSHNHSPSPSPLICVSHMQAFRNQRGPSAAAVLIPACTALII